MFLARSLVLVSVFTLQPIKLTAQNTGPLTNPDGKPADMAQPVQVFILLGQSNMFGFGKIGPADQPGSLAPT